MKTLLYIKEHNKMAIIKHIAQSRKFPSVLLFYRTALQLVHGAQPVPGVSLRHSEYRASITL